MSFGMTQAVAEDYRRQIEHARITSNVKRIRSLQKEDDRLNGKSLSS